MKNDSFETLLVIIIGIILMTMGFFVGISTGKEMIRKEAIEVGVAHYIVDAKTGQTKFVYIKKE